MPEFMSVPRAYDVAMTPDAAPGNGPVSSYSDALSVRSRQAQMSLSAHSEQAGNGQLEVVVSRGLTSGIETAPTPDRVLCPPRSHGRPEERWSPHRRCPGRSR